MTATETTDLQCLPQAVAVLFDFNGVLVDDEPIHYQAFQNVLGAAGRTMHPDVYRRYLGLDDRGTFVAFLREMGDLIPDEEIAQWVARKQAVYAALLEHDRRQGRAHLFPGAFDLVHSLHDAGVPLGIVSGARRAEIEASLMGGGLTKCFRVIVAAEDVPACKPDPAGYRLAYERLRAICPGIVSGVAIEDAPAGIAAARAAGLRCVGVTTSCTPRELVGADRIVHTLREIDPRRAIVPSQAAEEMT
ncbi:MAG: HAD family phosphatase [Deltaproteobacteria bacterium]|nr:HAD family phosphatase [Deltaproteobacteria bacterium]